MPNYAKTKSALVNVHRLERAIGHAINTSVVARDRVRFDDTERRLLLAVRKDAQALAEGGSKSIRIAQRILANVDALLLLDDEENADHARIWAESSQVAGSLEWNRNGTASDAATPEAA